jgi:membrane-associated protease RseP (regulator of RpoE activity)
VPSDPFEVEVIGPDGLPIGVFRPKPPPPRRIWLHLLLFGITFVTTTLFGGLAFAELPEGFQAQSFAAMLLHPLVLTAGLAFSVPLMGILLVHEMGHYLTCRAHRLDASLPYFIPVPFGVGTLGALIRIRSPLTGKRELFDVGASGPLAGFIATLPVLIVGLLLSHPVASAPRGGYLLFGEPLAFKLLSHLLHPEMPAGGDLLLHPTGFAAWFGLLVTALNLLPFGQLDGGHITYALFGKLQRRAAWPLLLVLLALGFLWIGWWVWVVIALIIGVRHPWIPDEEASLDRRRVILGWICIVVFVLCFTPEPIRIVP